MTVTSYFIAMKDEHDVVGQLISLSDLQMAWIWGERDFWRDGLSLMVVDETGFIEVHTAPCEESRLPSEG